MVKAKKWDGISRSGPMGNHVVKSENAESRTDSLDQDQFDFTPFLNFLQTETGHELATKILNIIDDVKKATIRQTSSHTKLDKYQQILIIMSVILATSVLTYLDKFTPTIGFLFGTLVGYAFGKKKN